MSETVKISRQDLTALRSLQGAPTFLSWNFHLPCGGQFKMEIIGNHLRQKDAKLVQAVMPYILQTVDDVCEADNDVEITAEIQPKVR